MGILGGAFGQRGVHRKARSQLLEADSPSLPEVARAAGRSSEKPRQQLSQSAGMAGLAALRPPLEGSLPGAWSPADLAARSAVPSFSLIRWFYRLFHLTQS